MKTSANPCSDPKKILAMRLQNHIMWLMPFKKSKMFPFPHMKPSKVIIYTSIEFHKVVSPRLSCPVGLLDVALGSNQPDGEKIPSRDQIFAASLEANESPVTSVTPQNEQKMDAQSGCVFFEVSLIQFLVAIFRFQLGAIHLYVSNTLFGVQRKQPLPNFLWY